MYLWGSGASTVSSAFAGAVGRVLLLGMLALMLAVAGARAVVPASGTVSEVRTVIYYLLTLEMFV